MQKVPPEKTARWAQILRESASPDAPIDHGLDGGVAVSRLRASEGGHRNWLVACLHALDARRSGMTLDYASALPDLSLPAPAAVGAGVAGAIWKAYLLYVLGHPGAGDLLAKAVRSLDPTALLAGIDDNPEPWWANELLILHALQSYVSLSKDADLQNTIGRCVEFHLAEIQPDHATNEPWAIHAFVLHPQGETSAGALLHAAMVQGGGSLTPVASLIVRDALHCLTNVNAYP